MRRLVFILMSILIYSCSKSQITESNNVDNDATVKDNSTQIQNSMQAKPITYDLIKDIPIKDVIKEYPPISEETFILGSRPSISI